jgi:hypothetical protein
MAIKKFTFTFILAIVVFGCGSGGSVQTVSSPWIEEGWIQNRLTSTCSIVVNGQYRIFGLFHSVPPGIGYVNSGDGRTFSTPIATGIKSNGNVSQRNPSVIKLTNNQFMMIYEVVDENEISRFHRATSTDGSAFSHQVGPLTNGAVMEASVEENNFISVPDMIMVDDKIYIYYVGNKSLSRVFYATSTDNGETWVKGGQISIDGMNLTDKIVDPDVIVMPNGEYRLFFAYAKAYQRFGEQGIKAATSSNGINFIAEEGHVIPSEEGHRNLDPDVIELIDQVGAYRMYFGRGPKDASEFNLYSALSN